MTNARFMSVDGYADFYIGQAPMVLVGSHPDCDIRIPSSRVSRFHCCLTRVDDQVLIRDLESTNGIRINGQRVKSGSLKAGDELAICYLCYRLQFVESAPEEPFPVEFEHTIPVGI
jgi:predicted component of type VI protein secretion system